MLQFILDRFFAASTHDSTLPGACPLSNFKGGHPAAGDKQKFSLYLGVNHKKIIAKLAIMRRRYTNSALLLRYVRLHVGFVLALTLILVLCSLHRCFLQYGRTAAMLRFR